MIRTLVGRSALALAALAASYSAGPTAAGVPVEPGPTRPARIHPARIQWFGTLEAGLAEAARTGRPILLSAASPTCDGVPGRW